MLSPPVTIRLNCQSAMQLHTALVTKMKVVSHFTEKLHKNDVLGRYIVCRCIWERQCNCTQLLVTKMKVVSHFIENYNYVQVGMIA